MARKGAKLASCWLPRGAAELEKRVQQGAKEVQAFRQRRQQAAAQSPRKARLLWILPLPLIPAIVIALGSGQFTVFAVNACAYGLYLAGGILARYGFQQEVKLRQQRFQTNSRWPLKTMGGVSVALATALTAWAGAGHSIPIALAFGGGALAAFILLYGLDPRRQTVVVENQHGNVQRVTDALRQAEKKIIGIEQASGRINQPELNQRLTRIIALARDILAEIARDPRDLRRASKFLNTYLDGAERVVTGYAETHIHHRDQSLEANFRRVLVTIEEVFRQQYQRLLENDLRDLDVNMEVLESQLKREGLN
jgi:5-bromo-4-chloroindolyl phosphate hydrolysis protein